MSNLDASNNGNNYYLLQNTTYDAAGQIELQWLGETAQALTPVLVKYYTFYGWTT